MVTPVIDHVHIVWETFLYMCQLAADESMVTAVRPCIVWETFLLAISRLPMNHW